MPRRSKGRATRGGRQRSAYLPLEPAVPPEPLITPEVPVEPLPTPMHQPELPHRRPRRLRPTVVGPPPVPESPLPVVKELGAPQAARPKSKLHCLSIIGQIEGHLVLPSQNKTTKYEHLIPQLVAIEQNPDIEGLLVILNTVGGDVEAGLAIAEMIASLSKPTVSLVLGGGHSIGVPIAVAGDYSFIANTATMTIHPIRLTGLVIGVPQTYEYLDKMQDRVVKFVVANSRITEAEYRELMFRTGELARDIGTVLVGRDAVKVGLIDEVGGLASSVEKLEALVAQRERGYRKAARRKGRGRRRSSRLQGPAPRGAAGKRGGSSVKAGAAGGSPAGAGKQGRRPKGRRVGTSPVPEPSELPGGPLIEEERPGAGEGAPFQGASPGGGAAADGGRGDAGERGGPGQAGGGGPAAGGGRGGQRRRREEGGGRG